MYLTSGDKSWQKMKSRLPYSASILFIWSHFLLHLTLNPGTILNRFSFFIRKKYFFKKKGLKNNPYIYCILIMISFATFSSCKHIYSLTENYTSKQHGFSNFIRTMPVSRFQQGWFQLICDKWEDKAISAHHDTLCS